MSRCKLCGEDRPLVKAHIIAWRRVGAHSAGRAAARDPGAGDGRGISIGNC